MTTRQTWCAYIGGEQIQQMVGKHVNTAPKTTNAKKLTAAEIAQIRADAERLKRLRDELSVPAWAKRLGVSETAIYKALAGKTYKDFA